MDLSPTAASSSVKSVKRTITSDLQSILRKGKRQHRGQHGLVRVQFVDRVLGCPLHEVREYTQVVPKSACCTLF